MVSIVIWPIAALYGNYLCLFTVCIFAFLYCPSKWRIIKLKDNESLCVCVCMLRPLPSYWKVQTHLAPCCGCSSSCSLHFSINSLPRAESIQLTSQQRMDRKGHLLGLSPKCKSAQLAVCQFDRAAQETWDNLVGQNMQLIGDKKVSQTCSFLWKCNYKLGLLITNAYKILFKNFIFCFYKTWRYTQNVKFVTETKSGTNTFLLKILAQVKLTFNLGNSNGKQANFVCWHCSGLIRPFFSVPVCLPTFCSPLPPPPCAISLWLIIIQLLPTFSLLFFVPLQTTHFNRIVVTEIVRAHYKFKLQPPGAIQFVIFCKLQNLHVANARTY